jgi:hypothetical protein
LTLPRFFKIDSRVKVVAALCAPHDVFLVNIREITEEDLQDAVDQDEDQVEERENSNQDQQSTGTGYHIARRERNRPGAKRDAIAKCYVGKPT